MKKAVWIAILFLLSLHGNDVKVCNVEQENKTELRILKNLPYAKRGYSFEDTSLSNFFKNKKWYQEDENYEINPSDLIEKELEWLAKIEKKKIDDKNFLEYIKEYERLLKWRKDKSGLLVNDIGDIAFPVHLETEMGLIDYNISKFSWTDIHLKDVINLESFKRFVEGYGDQYFVDENRVYYYSSMSGGGTFNLADDIDREGFYHMGNSQYYANNKHIYFERTGLMKDADRETFVGIYPVGRDKNGYFLRGDRVKGEELQELREKGWIERLDEIYDEKSGG